MVIYMNMFCQFVHVFVVLLVFLHITGATPVSGGLRGFGNVSFKCVEKERQALFHLKNKLVDDYGRLSSWTDTKDCCKWEGVECDGKTGHVTVLDLRGPNDDPYLFEFFGSGSKPLRGMISSSFLELKELSYLDLSFNDFNDGQIPEFIGSFNRLKYLNLSYSKFAGPIPPQIGNLSQLQILDLQFVLSSSKSLDWLSNLRSLRYLDLSQIYLAKATNWLQVVGNLPLLQELILSSCNFQHILAPPFSLANSSASLATLDLSSNDLLSSSVFTWLFNFSSSLTRVELQYNNLQGNIPSGFGDMKSLVYLNLSNNPLEGGIPKSFGNMSNLESLDLSFMHVGLSGQLPELMNNLSGHAISKLKYLNLGRNKISGLFPDISRFSSLTVLRLDSNKLSGLSLECCSQHSNLVFLDLSWNRISGPLPGFANFPHLRVIYLGQNQFSGPLPESIRSLSHLEILSLPSNHLEGTISDSHFSKLSKLQTLSLSFNPLLVLNFSAVWFPPFQLNVVELSLSFIYNPLNVLDISGTGISDSIPTWFWDISSNMTFLNMSHNQIHGVLPDLSSKFSVSPIIDLSYNNLTGLLPSLPPDMSMLDLSRNKFWGRFLSCATLQEF